MDRDELLVKLNEIEDLLKSGIAGHFETVERLAIAIARNAPSGNVANLAMRLLSAVYKRRRDGDDATASVDLNNALSLLRLALERAQQEGKPD